MDESLFSQYCWIADVTGFYINILFGHILSYVLGILHLHVLDSLDSWKYHFQKDLNIIDSSNLNYKIAVVNMIVYLWAILGIIHLWCPHKGCAWGSDIAEEKAKIAVGCRYVKGKVSGGIGSTFWRYSISQTSRRSSKQLLQLESVAARALRLLQGSWSSSQSLDQW